MPCLIIRSSAKSIFYLTKHVISFFCTLRSLLLLPHHNIYPHPGMNLTFVTKTPMSMCNVVFNRLKCSGGVVIGS